MTRSPTENPRSRRSVISSDLAGGLEEPVGEPVELSSHGVAPVHDGVVETGLVCAPPAGENLAVVVEFVLDEVQVPSGVQQVQGGSDVAGA
jgi:hypothetical protein